MNLDFKDKVKRFMFLEDKSFKSRFKDECVQESFIEKVKSEAYFRS